MISKHRSLQRIGAIAFVFGSVSLTLLMLISFPPHTTGKVFGTMWPLMLALFGTMILGVVLIWAGRTRRSSN
jgi:hypothetical protein